MKKHVAITSRETYKELQKEGILFNTYVTILLALKKQAGLPVSRRKLANLIQAETSSVAGRCNELIKYGYIDEDPDERIVCSISGKTVKALRLGSHGYAFFA